MLYCGIDLAWKEGNPSGLAIIDENKRIIFSTAQNLQNDEMVKLFLNYNEDFSVSIDSPLQVKNEKGGRACDSLLMKQQIHGKYLKAFATSRSYMIKHYGSIRGEELLERFQSQKPMKLGENIAETFPSAVYLSLFPNLFEKKYKLSSSISLKELQNNFAALIEEMIIRGFSGDFPDPMKAGTKKQYKILEDEIDGILCAINSYYVFKLKSFYQFGSGENGLTMIARD